MDENRTASQQRDLSHYQVVRQEFVSEYDDIIVTFNRGRFYINSYGLSQFPDQDYIQVLVDEDTKSVVLKPSAKKKRDSFIWSGGLKKRKPRHIKCIPLFYLLFQMMEWNIDARYQIKGNIEDYGEERVLFLDLSIHDVAHNHVTEDGKKLEQWISQQRGIRKGTRKHSIGMTAERIALLDEIGMDWEPPLSRHKPH